jgi:hypothetical protein
MSRALYQPSRLEAALEDVRGALREAAVDQIARTTVGGVIEIFAGVNGSPQAALWPNGGAYARRERPAVLDAEEMMLLERPGSRAHLGIWLFGPERISRPGSVARWLSRMLEPRSPLVVASETPWPGKALAPDEVAEQTGEELSAMLTRSGFGAFFEVVEGPVFRLWTAVTAAAPRCEVLASAEDRLREGDWLGAQAVLYGPDLALSSLAEVREYSLLVAACHDLAGRTELCLDALEETLALDPECTRAMCGLARLYALDGHLDSARALFGAALDVEPACEAARCGLLAVDAARAEETRPAIAPLVICHTAAHPALPGAARA